MQPCHLSCLLVTQLLRVGKVTPPHPAPGPPAARGPSPSPAPTPLPASLSVPALPAPAKEGGPGCSSCTQRLGPWGSVQKA